MRIGSGMTVKSEWLGGPADGAEVKMLDDSTYLRITEERKVKGVEYPVVKTFHVPLVWKTFTNYLGKSESKFYLDYNNKKEMP